jgi:tetratricopeptide (TPR) repeat protein
MLDVPLLLERSHPLPRRNWMRYAVVAFVVLILFGSIAGNNTPQFQTALRLISAFLMVVLVAVMGLVMYLTVRDHRAEQNRMLALEEMVQLRRWEPAATMLDQTLSRPMLNPYNHAQALLYLSTVLARYHRYEDAIAVHDYLLDVLHLEGPAGFAARLGRAMSMVHEDHLVDADRAISELRRMSGDESAGLTLIEIYRDVKTGHPAEAIDLFTGRRDLLRGQLGHRFADACVLAAKAYDLVGQSDRAATAYRDATILSPVVELNRRYPEVTKLAEKYPAATVPSEAA